MRFTLFTQRLHDNTYLDIVCIFLIDSDNYLIINSDSSVVQIFPDTNSMLVSGEAALTCCFFASLHVCSVKIISDTFQHT